MCQTWYRKKYIKSTFHITVFIFNRLYIMFLATKFLPWKYLRIKDLTKYSCPSDFRKISLYRGYQASVGLIMNYTHTHQKTSWFVKKINFHRHAYRYVTLMFWALLTQMTSRRCNVTCKAHKSYIAYCDAHYIWHFTNVVSEAFHLCNIIFIIYFQ